MKVLTFYSANYLVGITSAMAVHGVIPSPGAAVIGRYRIYPSWFYSHGGVSQPMNELAQLEARRLERVVDRIEVIGEGSDHRGNYIDFNVTCSSTQL